MIKALIKRYLPDEIIEIYYSFHQKRLDRSMQIPTSNDVLSVGLYTYGADNLRILFRDSGEKVKIGKFCSIAKDVTIVLGGGHRHDWITTYPFGHVAQTDFGNEQSFGHPTTKGSVTIGNDVWIGFGVTIMSGVSIGDGSVIAANSHIVNDVPPFGIAGGNPGKLIKLRFDEETVARLVKVKWWDFPIAEVNRIKMAISQRPSEEVLTELENIRRDLDGS
jgi:acetyltransferase-like isoleucine patch superfamily enzyme